LQLGGQRVRAFLFFPHEIVAQFDHGRNVSFGDFCITLLEAAGDPGALRQAVECLAPLGVCCLVGSARKGVAVALEMPHVQHGRTLRGCIQGDAPPEEFLLALFAHHEAGRMPVERLIRQYEFAEVNRAVEDSVQGRTVKAVLRIGSDL
jgi:aryl-alcohol dehydrogenase